MALETSQLGLQLRNFAQLIAGNITSIEPFTKQPSVMQSLSSQFKALHTFEKRQECQLDAPTSGESSPCLSDSELPSRFAMPTLQEVSDILTDELSLEVDSTLEKLKEIDRRELTLIFEDLEPGFQKGWFYRYLKEVRYNNSPTDRYLTIKEMKTICFRGNNSIVVNFYVKKHDAIYDFFKTFQSYVRNETRRPIKIHRVIGDRRIRESWFAVVIRNLPPKVTQKEITDQCQRDLKDPITVGTLIKVKDRHCCLVRCEYLEDAEVICRKLNDFQLKDHQTYIKYVVKAHLHPHCTLKHLAIEKSPFSDFIKSSKGSKHGISELLHLFKSNKKPSSTYENIKPPPPPPIDKRRGPMEEEKMDSMPTNGMDYYNKRSYSDHSRNQNRTPNKMPLEPVMSQEPANFPRVNESAPQEGDAKGPSDENLNGQDGQKEDYGERKLEEEERNPDYKRGKNEGNKLSIRKDYGEKRYDKRHERSSSRHERRSSSRRRKHNYEKDDYSKRSSRYNQSKDYDRHKKHRSHKESRDRKRNHSRSRNSKSKSRSKSRSRSKERVKNHRHNDYKKGRNQSNFQKSPKRSNSSTRKRNASKNRSKSPSKSRSRSSHREKQKEEKSKNKTVNSYEYEHKDNQSENGRSPSPSKKNKKRRDSRSHSRDKSKRRNDNSPQKPYYNQNREHGNKYQDYQKNSYNRKDNRDTRGHHDYKTQKRNNYSSRNDYRDYDDKHRKRNRDHDKSHRARDRSRSKKSKSPDRRSASRSRSSRDSRKRNGSNEKRVRMSSSESRRAGQQGSQGLKIVTNNEGSKDNPKEKN